MTRAIDQARGVDTFRYLGWLLTPNRNDDERVVGRVRRRVWSVGGWDGRRPDCDWVCEMAEALYRDVTINAWCMELFLRGGLWCSGLTDRYEKVLRTLQSRGAFFGDFLCRGNLVENNDKKTNQIVSMDNVMRLVRIFLTFC